MPHVPRPPGRLAPTTGPRPEFLPTAGKAPEVRARAPKLGIGRISLKTYEVKPETVFEQMFGEKPRLDQAGAIIPSFGILGGVAAPPNAGG